MNKIKLIILVLCSLILIPSCDLLDLKPEDRYGIDDYWQSKDHVERFFAGLHRRVRDRQINYLKLGEMRGGLFDSAASSVLGQGKSDIPIVGNTLSYENPGVTVFGNFYMDIMQINHAIDKLNNEVTFLKEDEHNYYLGIAHGLRAFAYFHMFRSWGGLPIVETPDVLAGVTSPMVLNKARSDERTTWGFIRDDIQKSQDYFKDLPFTYNAKYGKNFWSKAASSMLYADVLLWGAKVSPIGESTVLSDKPSEDVEKARVALTAVWNLVGYLPNDFPGVFSYENKGNDEIIYSIYYGRDDKATNSFALFTYNASALNGYVDGNGVALNNPLSVGTDGGSRYEYSWDFFSNISPNDKRRAATFQDFYKGTIKGTYLKKFAGTMDGDIRYFVDDWPIYRNAEAVLMLAECYNYQNNAGEVKNLMETIRRRAYGRTFPAFVYKDKQQTELDILYEYAVEFVAEGKYWYNVRRMNGGSEALKLVKNNDPKFLLWPIDAATLSRDPLVLQNEAYKTN